MPRENRKLAIVKAALPLFARKGFAETTTKDLAQAAGVSEPLLYKHFPSKEALYLEIQTFSCQNFDPVIRRLDRLKPCTATLVHLVYHLLRTLILGSASTNVEWETRHRLMLNSLLHDGVFARLIYQNRFEQYCQRIESSLQAAIKSGEAVAGPVSIRNRSRFAHHVGAWLALAHLPAEPAIDYQCSPEELLNQSLWFALRGMGMTDSAIAVHYEPSNQARFFDEIQTATHIGNLAKDHPPKD